MVGVVAALLVVGAIGAFTAYRVSQRNGPATPDHATSDYGFTLTEKNLVPRKSAKENPRVVAVQLWDDFSCADCRAFNKAVSGYLRSAVRAGDVELTLYPFVTGADTSTNRYAERAANAAACVGDIAGPKGYAAMHDRLLAEQPRSGKAGAGDSTLIAWGRSFGAKDLDDCVRDEKFVPWLVDAATEARRTDVSHAPVVKVAGRKIVSPGKNGGEVMPDKKELKFAIDAAARGKAKGKGEK